jgi:hypothetical protein
MANYILLVSSKVVEAEKVMVFFNDQFRTWYTPPNSWVGARNGTYWYDSDNQQLDFSDPDDYLVLQLTELDYPDDCNNLPSSVLDTDGRQGWYSVPNKLWPQELRWFRYTPPSF